MGDHDIIERYEDFVRCRCGEWLDAGKHAAHHGVAEARRVLLENMTHPLRTRKDRER